MMTPGWPTITFGDDESSLRRVHTAGLRPSLTKTSTLRIVWMERQLPAKLGAKLASWRDQSHVPRVPCR